MTITLLANLAPAAATQGGGTTPKAVDQGFAAALNKAKPAQPADTAEPAKLQPVEENLEQASEQLVIDETLASGELPLSMPVPQQLETPDSQPQGALGVVNETALANALPVAAPLPQAEPVAASDVIERTPLASSIMASIHMGRMMDKASPQTSLDKAPPAPVMTPEGQVNQAQSMPSTAQLVSDVLSGKTAPAAQKTAGEPFHAQILNDAPQADDAADVMNKPANVLAFAREPLQANAAAEMKPAETTFKIEAGAPVMQTTPASPTPAAAGTQHLATHSAIIQTPVTNPQWGQALSQQLMNFTMKGDQNIEIQLNPLELGPMTVSLKMNELQATAHFSSHNLLVRQALEQAIPQLRETMSEQGIQLGEASVSDQRQQQFAEGERKAAPGIVAKAEREQSEPQADDKVSNKLPQNSQISTYA